MTKVSNTLQQLVFGDRSTFIINLTNKDTDKVTTKQVTKTLRKLEKTGYIPTDPSLLFQFTTDELKTFARRIPSPKLSPIASKLLNEIVRL